MNRISLLHQFSVNQLLQLLQRQTANIVLQLKYKMNFDENVRPRELVTKNKRYQITHIGLLLLIHFVTGNIFYSVFLSPNLMPSKKWFTVRFLCQNLMFSQSTIMKCDNGKKLQFQSLHQMAHMGIWDTLAISYRLQDRIYGIVIDLNFKMRTRNLV